VGGAVASLTFFVAIMVTLALVSVRLDSDVGWSWNKIFAPLYIHLSTATMVSLLGAFLQTSTRWKFRIFGFSTLCALLVFQVVLLSNKLDAFFDSSWYSVLSPLWLLNGVIQIGLANIGIRIVGRQFYGLKSKVLNSTMCFMIWAPFIGFQVLLTAKGQNDLGHSSWAVCFLPLWVSLTCSFVWIFNADWGRL
jgi:hypothetical protein